MERAQYEAQKYFKASLYLNDSSNIAYAYDIKGLEAYARDLNDSAKIYGNLSIEYFRNLNDSMGLSAAIYNLSTYHEYYGEYATALRLLHIARDIDIKLGIKEDNDAFYFSRLSDIFYNQGQIELSLKLLHKAWGAYLNSTYDHSYLLPSLHLSYAWIYHDLDLYDLAEHHAKRAYSYTKPDSNILVRSGALEILSLTSLQAGDEESSLAYGYKALELSRLYGDPYYINYGQAFLMDLYIKMSRLDQASLYADSVLNNHGAYAKNPTYVADINSQLYEYFKAVKDDSKALYHLEISKEAKEKINNLDGLAAMKQFDEELAQREQMLVATKAKLQNEELNLRNTLLIATILILAGVLIFVGLLYISNKRIKSINEKLSHRNEEVEEANSKIEKQSLAIEERNLQLEKMNNSKDRLFSILTHDLRQPFNQMLGVIELMDNDQLNVEEREVLFNGLRDSVRNTSNLVSNVLVWSKAQFAGVSMNPEQLHLANTVKKALLHFSIALDKKNIRIIFDIPEHLSIIFDPDHFNSVLRNVFSNAYKFSHQDSEITIRAWVPKNGDKINLEIEDQGVGMNHHQIDQLLDPEKSSNTSFQGTLNEEGTGIGMIIVRDFLRENGATYSIESEVDKGTSFILSIPKGEDIDYKPNGPMSLGEHLND